MLKVVKNQTYQTRKEVCLAAGRGPKAAIRSSVRHWKELATAPVDDLLGKKLSLSSGDCALCEKYSGCYECPLYQRLANVKCYVRGELYHDALIAYQQIRDASNKIDKDTAVKRFRRVAEKLMNLLESLL